MYCMCLCTDARPGSVVGFSRQGVLLTVIGRLLDRQAANNGHSLPAEVVADIISHEPAICRWTTSGPQLDVQIYTTEWMSDHDVLNLNSRAFAQRIRSMHPEIQIALRRRRRNLQNRRAARTSRDRRRREMVDLRTELNNIRRHHPRVFVGTPEPESNDSLEVNLSGSPPPIVIIPDYCRREQELELGGSDEVKAEVNEMLL